MNTTVGMPHVARCSIALALSLAACAPPREDVAPAGDASVPTDVATDIAASPDVAPDASAPPDDAPAADPCDLRAEVPLRLRSPADRRRIVATLPAGTPIELLAVTDATRGPIDRLGVLSRVRVRTTGAEGFVYVGADAARRCQDRDVTSPDVSESRTVVVDGVEETWRVRFVTPSRAPEEVPSDEWGCGLLFEARFDRGRAVLERVRDGAVIDRFENPCGRDDGDECVRGLLVPWGVGPRRAGHRTPPGRLPRATFLDLGDYDHDGRATELALDVGHLVCGHNVSVIVGLTRSQPRLHVLSWADGEPMRMEHGRDAWEPVRASARGEMVTWGCGDHGASDEERLRWWPSRGRLRSEVITVAMNGECSGPADDGPAHEEDE